MRGIHRSVIVLLGLALATAPALAQKKGPAPAPAPNKDAPKAGDPEPEIEMEGDAKTDAKDTQVDPNEIDMGEPAPGDLSADLNAQDQNQNVVKAGTVTRTPLSWKDILVVVRKPFLKSHRTELYPFVGTTMNDNMIRHYTVGGEISYFLTDVLAIGVEGMYYVDTFREPFDLVARQARRLPTVNKYNWSGALNFHYVPVYGKFAILDRKLVTWEVQFTAGIGAGQSEVIPRDTTFDAFTTLLIMPNVGANMRFFLAKWLTVNVGVRDYMFIDKFEPTMRVEGGMNDSADDAKSNASTSFINNVMFQIGLSFWLPTSFEYTTFR
jgi:outer membrane beta-barrel protein